MVKNFPTSFYMSLEAFVVPINFSNEAEFLKGIVQKILFFRESYLALLSRVEIKYCQRQFITAFSLSRFNKLSLFSIGFR